MRAKLCVIQLARADVVVKPKVAHIGSSDFTKRHEAVLEGKKAALEAIPKIEGFMARPRGGGRVSSSLDSWWYVS
ncbi:MAG TPA: hypothetical protein VEI04_12490 [Syntrophobacteria bacterium]|nr:hypothetical protein [Syntrophobacteria bacterium]